MIKAHVMSMQITNIIFYYLYCFQKNTVHSVSLVALSFSLLTLPFHSLQTPLLFMDAHYMQIAQWQCGFTFLLFRQYLFHVVAPTCRIIMKWEAEECLTNCYDPCGIHFTICLPNFAYVVHFKVTLVHQVFGGYYARATIIKRNAYVCRC